MTGNGVVEIVRPIGIGGTVVHLAVPRHSRCHMIGEAWQKALCPDRPYRRPTDKDFAMSLMRGPVHGVGAHLWLKNRRNGLRTTWHTALAPAELRRVYRRHMHDRNAHARTI